MRYLDLDQKSIDACLENRNNNQEWNLTPKFYTLKPKKELYALGS
jgi:hypothetical protein